MKDISQGPAFTVDVCSASTGCGVSISLVPYQKAPVITKSLSEPFQTLVPWDAVHYHIGLRP